jgi:ribosomal-protein-alanine N-acetyltransferase
MADDLRLVGDRIAYHRKRLGRNGGNSRNGHRAKTVLTFINDGRPLPHDDIRSIIQRTLAMWDEHGYGPWAAVEKQSGRWVGRIGLNLLGDFPGPDKWEVGFELAREFWGRGLATEGARAAIRFGWAHTPLARIISVTVVEHLASRRVMEKCGLAFQAEMTFRGHLGVWYAVDRPGDQAEPWRLSHALTDSLSSAPTATG